MTKEADDKRFYEGKFTETEPDLAEDMSGIIGIIYNIYRQFSQSHIRNKFIAKMMKPMNGTCTVLDIGCGGGSRFLAKTGYVIGVDLSLSSLCNAQSIYDQVVCADISLIPFPDESFDFIISRDVLGHIPIERKSIVYREMLRLCKQGGRVIHVIEVESENLFSKFAKKYPCLFKRYFLDKYGHYGLETPEDACRRFKEIGFHAVKISPVFKTGIIQASHYIAMFDNEYRQKSKFIAVIVSIAKYIDGNKVLRGIWGFLAGIADKVLGIILPSNWAQLLLVCYEKKINKTVDAGTISKLSSLVKPKPLSKKYRILYLNAVSEIAGAEISLLELLQNINREVFEPLVALPGPGPLIERVNCLGIETIIVPQKKLKAKNPLPYLKTVFSLAELIRREHVDMIHCNVEIGNQYGVVAARLTGVPIISHTRGILIRRPFRRMFLAWADVLIANSYAVAESYSRYIAKFQKLVVVHNGVNLEKFSLVRAKRGLFRKKYNIPEDAFLIGHIARICPVKGQHILIDAIAKVAETYSNIYVLIVGDTKIDNSEDFLSKLKKRVYKFNLFEKVIFISYVDNMTELYADLDLVVLPSLSEPFGRVLIEAMAMEKPVVATRAGGAVEVVEDSVTGLLVPPNDHCQLTQAIQKMIKDKKLAASFGLNGRRRVEQLFNIEQNVRKTEQIYLETLHN